MTSSQVSAPSTPRILIVEDEGLIAEEIQDRLRRLKFNVVGVEATGEAAVRSATLLRPDIILMDIRLKGDMDSIEAARRIREQIDVPIVFLTAHADSSTLERAKQTGPLGYVLKPFNERELHVMLDIVLHRHRLECRLRESELRYRATLASIADGVLTTDRDGGVTFLNPVAESLTGWRAAEAGGHPCDTVLKLRSEQEPEIAPRPIRQALESDKPVFLTAPTVLLPRDGGEIPIEDSAAPIRDSDGRVLGAVIAFRDVRERRLAEAAMRKMEAELRQVQKLEAIGQLAAGVAHDFNNFLTVINGQGELLLLRGNLAPQDADVLRRMLDAAERSARLTRQLLAFGRRNLVTPRLLDLNRVISNTVRLLDQLLGAQIHTELRLAPDI